MPFYYNFLMKRNYSNYTDQDIILYCAESFSMAEVLRKLNLKSAGGNYLTLKRKLFDLKVDTAHWTNQGWNAGMQLKNFEDYSKPNKQFLIKERGNACESCELDEWKGISITLEIHHIDGDRSNNGKENLELLCPNCHSQTNFWRGRKNASVAKLAYAEGLSPSG